MAGGKRRRDEQGEYSLNAHDGGASSIRVQASRKQNTDAATTKRLKLYPASQARSVRATGRRGSQVASTSSSLSPGTDCLSPLSDELLIRILGNLDMTDLLSLASVSRRFHWLADDSQLWKAIYYERYVLPRALAIPGFRAGPLISTKGTTGETADAATLFSLSRTPGSGSGVGHGTADGRQMRTQSSAVRDRFGSWNRSVATSWKQKFKLRHNWARGKCAVEELRPDHGAAYDGPSASRDGGDVGGDVDAPGDGFHQMLLKVIDGIAVTADRKRGLRVWELKSRSLVATSDFSQRSRFATAAGSFGKARKGSHSEEYGADQARDEAKSHGRDDVAFLTPRSLAVDVGTNVLDIAVGLLDGGFDIWQFDLAKKALTRRFSHPASSSGPLAGIAYSHPFVLTATDSGLISLYAFAPEAKQNAAQRVVGSSNVPNGLGLSAPHLLTSLRSHTSRPPLALSIRKLALVTVASIVYTFSTRQGWSIGIQDLHVKSDELGDGDGKEACGFRLPTVVATRLASTLPVRTHERASSHARTRLRRTGTPSSSPLHSETNQRSSVGLAPMKAATPVPPSGQRHIHRESPVRHEDEVDGGPTTLCYSHPYLLASMPDNTLILHLCTSNASTLTISAGIRLWGHTSGISDAEITARGKAVSVSLRGEEMRVWELEGRPAAERGRSVAIRPHLRDVASSRWSSDDDGRESLTRDWDERRNWVGFDDEMVIVLKQSPGGRETLLMYDFT
ncbi:f-box domain containing protein [Sporothrix schenckii 1099-18]|uniref:F-box domain containing protein n=1 Tax=Sporothrix schenckii 1099-18 TaxID=1397361 RepID=A0A0F2M0T4_SPOSC|nr:f-box domain containing protein [Sporothrix schenckii 1099-18]KJR83312.1 f-box domain containing protein [Sporothrix schenckii 1099-18]